MTGMEFSAKLRTLLKRKRLSQEAVAKHVGVSQNLVSLWCRGKNIPDLKQAVVLAEALGVGIGYLADDEQDDEPLPLLTDQERALLILVRMLHRTHGLTVQDAAERIAAGLPMPPAGAKPDQRSG